MPHCDLRPITPTVGMGIGNGHLAGSVLLYVGYARQRWPVLSSPANQGHFVRLRHDPVDFEAVMRHSLGRALAELHRCLLESLLTDLTIDRMIEI